MTKDEEIEGIAVALDALLTAMAAEDARRAGDHHVGRTFAELVAAVDWQQTELQAGAAELIADPVGRALRNAVETLGGRLNEIGGMTLMRTVCDQVCALKPEADSWREHILDHRWSGIGDWMA